jgi:hypothetical protein
MFLIHQQPLNMNIFIDAAVGEVQYLLKGGNIQLQDAFESEVML